MPDDEDTFPMVLEGQHMAHTLVLKALIATHPRPDLLREVLKLYSEQSEQLFAENSTNSFQVEWFRLTLAPLLEQVAEQA